MLQDMAQSTIEHLIGKIYAINYLYFIKDELDAGGKSYNKHLYIIVRCKDEMLVNSTHMLPNTMMIRLMMVLQVKCCGPLKYSFHWPIGFFSNLTSDGHPLVIHHVFRKALDTLRWCRGIILALVFEVHCEWNIGDN
jgi:hypothetical protein